MSEPFVRAALDRQAAQLTRAGQARRRDARRGGAPASTRPGTGLLRSALARLRARRGRAAPAPPAALGAEPMTAGQLAEAGGRPGCRAVTVVVVRLDLGDVRGRRDGAERPRVVIELPEDAVLTVAEPACAPGGGR